MAVSYRVNKGKEEKAIERKKEEGSEGERDKKKKKKNS